MPLTEFQREVFRVLKGNRSPDSFVMRATVLHARADSPRFSRDIDLSHDIAESVAKSAELDSAALGVTGYDVEFLIQQPTFQRATVAREDGQVLLEWVFDSAFRFFPIETDPELGFRLHFFDAATNKVLALASRSEARDFVDALELHRNHLSIGALAWAAAGKDEGLNPMLILELSDRFAHHRQAEIDSLDLAEPLDLKELRDEWQVALQEGRELVTTLPVKEVGCLYLDNHQQVVEPDPHSDEFNKLRRHFGSVGGAWPRIGGGEL